MSHLFKISANKKKNLYMISSPLDYVQYVAWPSRSWITSKWSVFVSAIHISLFIQAQSLGFILSSHFLFRLSVLKTLPLNFSCMYFSCQCYSSGQQYVLSQPSSNHILSYISEPLVQNTVARMLSLLNRKCMKLMIFLA